MASVVDINKDKDGTKLLVNVGGRVDSTTAPQFEEAIKESIDGITDLTIDFKELEYISSAGLRVLLSTQKIMNKQGQMVIKNVSEEVMDIFEVTGFVDMLTIE